MRILLVCLALTTLSACSSPSANNSNSVNKLFASLIGNEEDLTQLTETEISGEVHGSPMVIYRSQLSIQHGANQPQLNDPVILRKDLYRFIVTADAAGAVELKRLTFGVEVDGMKLIANTPTNNSPTSGIFHVYQVSNGIIDDTNLVGETTSSSIGNSTIVTLDFYNETIPAGSSNEYAIYVGDLEQQGTQTDDDAITFTILRDNLYSAPSDINTKKQDSKIIWSDLSDPNHSDTTQDWLNGYLLQLDSGAYSNNDPN